jgi:hypothetical protein
MPSQNYRCRGCVRDVLMLLKVSQEVHVVKGLTCGEVYACYI